MPVAPALDPKTILTTDRLCVRPLSVDGICHIRSLLKRQQVGMSLARFREHDSKSQFFKMASGIDDPLEIHDKFSTLFGSMMTDALVDEGAYAYSYDYSIYEGSLVGDESSVSFDRIPCIVRQGCSSQQISCGDGATEAIPGVTTSYVYMGMSASLFGFHDEDMVLYSINYLAQGAFKVWYIVPPSFHDRALQAFRSDVRRCNEYEGRTCFASHMHKDLFLNPDWFSQHGIPVHVLVQKPGQAVVLFPRALHQGFNCGENVAIATNFGLPDWLQFGLDALVVSVIIRGCFIH